jgi:hypothetical protein
MLLSAATVAKEFSLMMKIIFSIKKNNRSGIEPSSSCAMGLLLNAQTMCTWL